MTLSKDVTRRYLRQLLAEMPESELTPVISLVLQMRAGSVFDEQARTDLNRRLLNGGVPEYKRRMLGELLARCA